MKNFKFLKTRESLIIIRMSFPVGEELPALENDDNLKNLPSAILNEPLRLEAFKRYPNGLVISDLSIMPLWTGDNNELCEICAGGGEILLCDFCNLSFHLSCFRPKMPIIPDGHWACPECAVDYDTLKTNKKRKISPTYVPAKRYESEASIIYINFTFRCI